MKFIWIFLVIIGLANGAINANWFAGYIMGVVKFATTFTPTPNYPDPNVAPAQPAPEPNSAANNAAARPNSPQR